MDYKWSLKEIYDGYDSKEFQEDLKKLDRLGDEMNEFSKGLNSKVEKETVRRLLLVWEGYLALVDKLYTYCSLCQSTNTQDSTSVSYLGQISAKMSNTAKANTIMKKYLAKIEDVEAFVQGDDLLTEYRYFIENSKKECKYLLSDEVEEVIAKLDINSAQAWSDLQAYLTSMAKAEYEGRMATLTELRNLAYDPDQKVRKAAYEAELLCYDKIKDAISFSLNSIKGQVNTICNLRGYESPLDMTLQQSNMKRETLDAMLSAMREYMPKFHAYLRRKGEMLGSTKGLAWYDLFAPLGKSETKFTVEEARDYLLKHFSKFAPDLTEMVKEAFDQEWIDFFPREGKVGGAFCADVFDLKQSRILTNFDGSLSDVVTLAHELGHAYHNLHIHDHRVLNTQYSMPVAETASTFNENIIMNAAIVAAKPEEKMALIEGQLQDLTQIICDIYSRFLFEKKVFEKREESFMFSDELKEIMLEAQKEAYGDGLDADTLHPYMWVCKGHYYSGALSFYNFPYAFGGLFARGLYAVYEKEGDAFLSKYQALLRATPVCDVEEVAKYAGIDLTNPQFWRDALAQVEKQIDEFLQLSKEI